MAVVLNFMNPVARAQPRTDLVIGPHLALETNRGVKKGTYRSQNFKVPRSDNRRTRRNDPDTKNIARVSPFKWNQACLLLLARADIRRNCRTSACVGGCDRRRERGSGATIKLSSAVLSGGGASRTINPIRFSSSKSSIRGSIWVGLGRGEQRN